MGNDRTPYPQGEGDSVSLLLIYTAINFAVTLVIVFGVTQKYQIGCGMVGSVYDVDVFSSSSYVPRPILIKTMRTPILKTPSRLQQRNVKNKK